MYYLIDLVDSLLHPKYLVMKGLSFSDRAIMFIGAHPTFKKDNYGNSVVSFENVTSEYYVSNIHKRIITFKGLIKWRRLIGAQSRCLQKKMFRWERIV